MDIILQTTISDVLLIIAGIAMLLIPVSALIWLIRKIMKKATKANIIWTVCLTAAFLILEPVGISLQCDHTYQLVESVPPTNHSAGKNTYICKICGNKRINELDQLLYYVGSQDEILETTFFVKSQIVGIWECDTGMSYNGSAITLTITQQNDSLIFERKTTESTDGIETDIVYIVNEFNETSAYHEDAKVTYLRVDDLLYEVTASDNVNIYSFYGYVDINVEKPAISINSGSSYRTGISNYSGSVRKRAMTAEEADALRGTGYHGTRPGSPAEHNELRAAQITCKICGYHSDNGANSICDYCYAKQKNSD